MKTKCWIGLGSNLGNRRSNLEAAAMALSRLPGVSSLRTSPIVETPALVPEGAPESWKKAYLNAAIELEYTYDGDVDRQILRLFKSLKDIERGLGRESGPRWAPRPIDLDLLLFGRETIRLPGEQEVEIPHREMQKRQFVLTPMKHLAPSLQIPSTTQTVLQQSRRLPSRLPLWCGILNLTPDSFSGAKTEADIKTLVSAFENENIQILDLGAESTRPGAQTLSADEEWERLAPTLEYVISIYKSFLFKPWISVDTYHPGTAEKALALGVDIINDVSGLRSPKMLELLQSHSCQYILMHSLSVPADSKMTLPDAEDPILAVRNWADQKLETLDKAGVAIDRILLDPGLGFGKTPIQSFVLVQRISELMSLPVRLFVGHSRKSFLNLISQRPAIERDPETLGVSLSLAAAGADILRVHSADIHQRVFRAFEESK